MQRITSYGAEEQVPEGTFLFQRGQRSVDFFLVLEGRIEVLDFDEHGNPRVVTTLVARQFAGELDLFHEREILVWARAAVDSRVVRVRRRDFHRMFSLESDLAEILMRAFILRRVGLIRYERGGVVLAGPGHGADTLRLQRFMTRNGYPHHLLDTEVDPDAGGLIARLKLTPDQLPVVVTPGKRVLRNPKRAPAGRRARGHRAPRSRARV